MELVEEFTFKAQLKAPLPVGAGPIGTRMFYEVVSGEVTGTRLNGKVLSGGEWALIGADGVLRVDVRLQIETDDGAFMYVQYVGVLELSETVQEALEKGLGTDYGDQYFYINPRIETGDERYAWVNKTYFVGEGRFLPNLGVEYRVSRPL